MATPLVSWQFLLASAAVIVTPGPDIALLTSILLRADSRRPAIQAASGMILAGACHALLGLGGVTLLLSAHPGALVVFRTAGGVILAGYGLMMLRGCLAGLRPRSAALRPVSRPASEPVPHPFLSGLGCTAANPKVGLFLVAFLPQFLPATGSSAADLSLLAAIYLGLGALWLALWIYLVGSLRQLAQLDRVRPAIELVTGVGLLVFAARLATG